MKAVHFIVSMNEFNATHFMKLFSFYDALEHVSFYEAIFYEMHLILCSLFHFIKHASFYEAHLISFNTLIS